MQHLISVVPKKWIVLGYVLATVILLCAPIFLSDFRLNVLAKFLAFCILAIGIDLIWGYTGILSLGHGVFFGLGAYCMAMYLKLEATEGKLPDFMGWSGLSELPWFWLPFQHFGFALFAAVGIPVILALLLGFVTFRNRIRGVYFTILTQALVIITVTLFVGQQAFTGGTNGITGFRTILGFPLASPEVKTALYIVTALTLLAVIAVCHGFVKTRLARVLKAIRDGENRVRFLGFDPTYYKMFIFAVSASLAGLAGVFFVLHVGIISPSMMGIVPSIEMVLWVAIGGRGTLIGAVIGALVINYAKTAFSEAYPDGWLYFLGGLFVVVVIFLPNGIVGVLRKIKPFTGRMVIRLGWNKGLHTALRKSDR